MKPDRGILAALGAAVLFGLSTPIAKGLVGEMPPLLLAGILYAGSGVGLGIVLAVRAIATRRTSIVRPRGADWIWLSTGGNRAIAGCPGVPPMDRSTARPYRRRARKLPTRGSIDELRETSRCGRIAIGAGR